MEKTSWLFVLSKTQKCQRAEVSRESRVTFWKKLKIGDNKVGDMIHNELMSAKNHFQR